MNSKALKREAIKGNLVGILFWMVVLALVYIL
jgi:hypothetical protein